MRVTGESGHLILVTQSAKGPSEDAAAISPAQAETLLGLTAGQIEYLSIAISIGNDAATIQRLLTPGPLDLVSVAFKHDNAAGKFQPPAWFGPEVSANPSYRVRAITFDGLPPVPEFEVSNAALHGLLNGLDHWDQEAEPHPTRLAEAPTLSEPAFAAEMTLNSMGFPSRTA